MKPATIIMLVIASLSNRHTTVSIAASINIISSSSQLFRVIMSIIVIIMSIIIIIISILIIQNS